MLAVLLFLLTVENGPMVFASPGQGASLTAGPAEGSEIIEEVVEGLTGGGARAQEDPDRPRDENPLRTIDTASPRSTLTGFLSIMEAEYEHLLELLQSYLASGRLYMSEEENALIDAGNRQLEVAARAFNIEDLPPALVSRDFLRGKAIQLKGILNRLDLPAAEEIPDATDMARQELKRWAIPDTEITLARVSEGERAGEYLFTPETLKRLDEFYERVTHLPHRAGSSVGWYQAYNYGAGGLRKILPYRWIMELPAWTKARLLDQPIWRWFGIIAVVSFLLLAVRIARSLARRLSATLSSGGTLWRHWLPLTTPLTLVGLLPLAAAAFDQNLRLSSGVGTFFEAATWGLFYLALTWAAWNTGGALSETIIGTQHLERRGIDSQLVRFGLRILVIMLAAAILVEGAYRVGLPAYSVVAGLGISGIAVALAARESLSNLLSSLIIMFEKPFRIGHWIRTGETEGTVESVNFRSTRIRTFYNSVVSIPNNKLVETTVDNMELRQYRRQRFIVQVTYDTPSALMERFIDGIKATILASERSRKDYLLVCFNELGPHSKDILVYFFLRVPDYAAELAEREQILFRIVSLAEDLGIAFAFPTQTLHMNTAERCG